MLPDYETTVPGTFPLSNIRGITAGPRRNGPRSDPRNRKMRSRESAPWRRGLVGAVEIPYSEVKAAEFVIE
jgi:hypothetical protein